MGPPMHPLLLGVPNRKLTRPELGGTTAQGTPVMAVSPLRRIVPKSVDGASMQRSASGVITGLPGLAMLASPSTGQ